MKIYNVHWNVTTAGPSPHNNERTELFLFGCNRAKEGNPCKGCFNYNMWNDDLVEYNHPAKDIAENIAKHAPNKYITISGGEPLDQKEELSELVEILRDKGFHIMIYSWRKLQDLLDMNDKHIDSVLSNIDMLVDGEFIEEESMYQRDGDDGLFSSVGSGNQVVWDIANAKDGHYEGYALRDMDALFLREDNELIYLLKNSDSAPATATKLRKAG